MAHEFKKEFNEQFRFWVIACPEGCMITSWKEGDDIMDYGSFAVAYCPENADFSAYHCVTVEEDGRLKELQMAKIKEMEENR